MKLILLVSAIFLCVRTVDAAAVFSAETPSGPAACFTLTAGKVVSGLQFGPDGASAPADAPLSCFEAIQGQKIGVSNFNDDGAKATRLCAGATSDAPIECLKTVIGQKIGMFGCDGAIHLCSGAKSLQTRSRVLKL
jgi:hypothetical protein